MTGASRAADELQAAEPTHRGLADLGDWLRLCGVPEARIRNVRDAIQQGRVSVLPGAFLVLPQPWEERSFDFYITAQDLALQLAEYPGALVANLDQFQEPNEAPGDDGAAGIALSSPEAAREAGVPTNTLLYWARNGILHPDRDEQRAGVAARWPAREVYLAKVAAMLRGRRYSLPRVREVIERLRGHEEPFRGEWLLLEDRGLGDSRVGAAIHLCSMIEATWLMPEGMTAVAVLVEPGAPSPVQYTRTEAVKIEAEPTPSKN